MTSPAPPTDNVRGAAWMVASALMFSIGSVLIKAVGQGLPSPQVVFFRCLFGLAIVVPFVARHGLTVFRTQRPDLHIVRILCATVAMLCGFYATSHLELATAVSLSYTRPLFMIVIAVMFLGEIVRWRRGLATFVGFLGVVIMLGPSGIALSLPALAGLMSALAVTGAMAVVKQQSAVDGVATIMTWFAVGTVVVTAVPAALVWQTPPPAVWAEVAALGLVSTTGQYFMFRALSIGELTVMNPIDYLQIIIGAASGLVIFGEVPTIWTLGGAGVIVASTLYILFREAAINKPPMPLVKDQ
jgi:drug/metabolite transporter (DMT)-like permease